MSRYIGKHRAPRTPSSQRATLAAGTTAMVVSMAGAVPAAASNNTVSNSLVTVQDGCGRSDALSIKGNDGPYKVWLPGQTMPDPNWTPPADDGKKKAPKVPMVPAYDIVTGSSWVRTASPNGESAKGSKGGLAIKVTDRHDRYVPITDGRGSVLGTETFAFTNEDCATPVAPTFNDQQGTDNDTVTIPDVPGVSYKGGKPGTNPAKGTVTITATAASGYRLADRNGNPISPADATWTYTFSAGSTISVPDTKKPVFRRGLWVNADSDKAPKAAKGSKPATDANGRVRTPNVVILHPIEGVEWKVDGTTALGAGKASKSTKSKNATPSAAEPVEYEVGTKSQVKVEAVSADPKLWTLTGTTEWQLGEARKPASTVPVVTAPLAQAGLPLGRARVNWKVPFGVEGNYTYDIAFRHVYSNARGRSVSAWKKWAYDTSLTGGVLSGRPGGVYEVTARAVDDNGTASEWSKPTLVMTPLDIRTGPRRSWSVNNRAGNAYTGRTLVSSTRRGATWTTKAPYYTNSVTIWFRNSLQGGRAKIYVNGKHVAWAGTFDRAPKGGRMSVTVPVKWGRPDIKVVNDSIGRRTTVALDGIAYGR